MKKVITKENYHNFCYINDKEIKDTPKGLVLQFIGLGGMRMYSEFEGAKVYSEQNILFMIPYINPWNWMNDQTINEVNELVDVIKEVYNLPNLKIASSGGSMGGMSALTYAAYAKVTPAVVAAICPVCDLEYHYTERPDLPRTMYSAYYDAASKMEFQDVIKAHSPLRLGESEKLPKTKYLVIHCEQDTQVNIQKHSEKFIDVMKKNYDITFVRVPNRDHCDIDEESRKLYENTIINALK